MLHAQPDIGAHERHGPAAETAAAAPGLDATAIDARAVALLDNTGLRNSVLELERLELAQVWTLTQRTLASKRLAQAAPVSRVQVHHKLLAGLHGAALLVSAAMFLNTLAETEQYFDLSFKTLKARLQGALDAASSERALRAARVVMTAAEVLGSYDAARAYMHTRNFALGGATPAQLLKTAEGERVVLGELHAQAEGGPL